MASQVVVTIGGKEWTASVAKTATELLSGLGNVASMPPNTGMLFDLGSDQSAVVITCPRCCSTWT